MRDPQRIGDRRRQDLGIRRCTRCGYGVGHGTAPGRLVIQAGERPENKRRDQGIELRQGQRLPPGLGQGPAEDPGFLLLEARRGSPALHRQRLLHLEAFHPLSAGAGPLLRVVPP